MIEFAGYVMPVWYTSLNEEHRKVRTSAGAFDLSHMGEFFFRGPQALDRIQYLTSNNAAKLEVGQAQYTLVTNERGGIRDDVIVYHVGEDEWMMVVNAANVDKIRKHISEVFSPDVFEDRSDEITLVALQGPKAAEILGKLIPYNLADFKPFSAWKTTFGGLPITIARTGYTGEDGFELFVENEHALALWNAVLETGGDDVAPIGLGARDTLRLEVCYSLYGNEIDENSNPFAARLGWVIKLKKGDFIGHDALVAMKNQPMAQALVGLEAHSGPVPRHGMEVVMDGIEVGKVTSGCLSPMSGKRIALAYVPTELSVV
ncbi:MAG TPA: glycine cleavage system aminomethyltransferase GcvT, partial [Firmicutes bacterium]|nr:glycine cleavage system aminomethyltransferase GcvT [Bacillota bacterium]